jgi:putative hydrolases of HD superfamily
MQEYPSVDRLAELQQLIADFAKVERVPMFADVGRKETDVDHSYGLAMTCWYLQPKIAPDLNLGTVLQYALAHDIIEIHAGDTYSFDTEALKTKDSRERSALTQLKYEWPDFHALTDKAEGYMDKVDEEALFIKAVDKMLPIFMFELSNNPKQTWDDHAITLDMERQNKVTMHVSRYVSPYYDKLLNWLDERGNITKN